MKYTLCLTQQCNLVCTYCYIGKKRVRMSLNVARAVIDFIFDSAPPGEKIDIGFFGGEPLLEFELIKSITQMVEAHPAFDPNRVEFTIVTNGTIFSDDIARFVNDHAVNFGISCDGPPAVHDTFRRFANGRGSAHVVERTIMNARALLPTVLVNSVFHPKTLPHLPEVVDYFISLGLRQIYLNPDFSAPWAPEDIERLPEIYDQIGARYVGHYLKHDPVFISLIDSKIIVILRGGYRPLERCRMGRSEFAFTPEGTIFPCERLIGFGEQNDHTIGNVFDGIRIGNRALHMTPGRRGDNVLRRNGHDAEPHSAGSIHEPANAPCQTCPLRDYCMTWCGCSNYMSTGYYNCVSPFLCASERAAIGTSFRAFQQLEQKLGPTFFDHLAGIPNVRRPVAS